MNPGADPAGLVWSVVTPGVTENLSYEIAPSDSEWGAGNGDCYAAIGPCGIP